MPAAEQSKHVSPPPSQASATPTRPQTPGEPTRDSLFTFFAPPSPEDDAHRPEITNPRTSMIPSPLKPKSSNASRRSTASVWTTNTLYRLPSFPPPPRPAPSPVADAQTAEPQTHYSPTSLTEKKLGHSFDAEASLNEFLKPRNERSNATPYPPATPRRSNTPSVNSIPRKPVPVHTAVNPADARASKPFGFSYYAPSPSYAPAPTALEPDFRTARRGSPAPSSALLPGLERPITNQAKTFLHESPARPAVSDELAGATIQGPAAPPPALLGSTQSLPAHVAASLYVSDIESQKKKKPDICGMPRRIFIAVASVSSFLAVLILVIVIVVVKGKQRSDYAEN